jgi:hypothetical protein
MTSLMMLIARRRRHGVARHLQRTIECRMHVCEFVRRRDCPSVARYAANRPSAVRDARRRYFMSHGVQHGCGAIQTAHHRPDGPSYSGRPPRAFAYRSTRPDACA